jgi:hypothetical protein
MTQKEREKPGRKPLADKKQPITIYIPKSVINRLGGDNATRTKLHNILKENPNE